MEVCQRCKDTDGIDPVLATQTDGNQVPVACVECGGTKKPAAPLPLRLSEGELKELEDFIAVARGRRTSWATVPCGSLGVLIREVRDRRASDRNRK